MGRMGRCGRVVQGRCEKLKEVGRVRVVGEKERRRDEVGRGRMVEERE